MTENEAIEALKLESGLEITGRPIRVAQFFEGIDTAIKALEEVQQYRAIEKELKERYHANVDIPLLMHHFIETIFEGEKHEGFCILTNEDAKAWKEYQTIGMPEECRAAMEKQTAKKMESPWCPCCGKFLTTEYMNKRYYCIYCGQLLEWEGEL
jgi:hypothetical protein|nr:MAG TPA: ribosome, girodazole, girolline, antibiotic complex, 50S [Bacteriophage sp.]